MSLNAQGAQAMLVAASAVASGADPYARLSAVKDGKLSLGALVDRGTGIRTVMGSPPTITLGSVVSGSIPAPSITGTTYAPDSGYFRYGNTTPVAPTPLAGLTGMFLAGQGTVGTFRFLSIEFRTDADSFEWCTQIRNNNVRQIFVDGQAVASTMTTLAGTEGRNGWEKVDFGSRAFRNIRIETNAGYFGGVCIPTVSTMWKPHTATPPLVIAAGDSITGTVQASLPQAVFDNWCCTAGRILGWNVMPSGIPGTGYANTTSPPTLGTRLVADVTSYSPKAVIFAMGVNDQSYLSTVGDAAIACWQQVKAVTPTPAVIVIGPWGRSANHKSPSTRWQCQVAIEAAFIANPELVDIYISPIRGGWVRGGQGVDPTAAIAALGDGSASWITGSGSHTSGTIGHMGDGNSDYYSYDGTHPMDEGHHYLGLRVAQCLAEALDSGYLSLT